MPSQRIRLTSAVFAALGALVLAGGGLYGHDRYEEFELRRKAEALTGGNVQRGEQSFAAYGCGSCHSIPGVSGAQGKVGPPLQGIAGRATVGGRLENKPDNLMRWIVDPQAVSPGTAMPRLGVKPHEARDISAFLYTQS